MKKCWMVIVVVISTCVNAQVRWDGEAGDGLWNSAMNWVGNAIPQSSDHVLIDNSIVGGSYIVVLPAGNTTVVVSSITVTPSSPDTILLILPATNTADPGLQVTGAGDAFILNARARFRNSSGSTTGSGIAVLNTIRVNNGGRYIHNTARGNAAIVSQLSTAVGTETGEFEFDSPTGSATISLSTRHYGTLILSSAANSGTATYIGSGASPVNVHGDLIINTGVNFTITMTAAFIIHRNWVQHPSCTWNIQSSSNSNTVQLKGQLDVKGTVTESGSGLPRIELNGTTIQALLVTGSGSMTNSIEVVMNNPAGAVLQAPVTLPFNLRLTNGNIFTSISNLLTLTDGAQCFEGSSNSFISGPLRKLGDDPFEYKVGKGGIYAPLQLLNESGQQTTDAFVVEYQRSSPQQVSTPSFELPIDHVSFVEYWSIDRTNGGSSKRVGLKVHELSFAADAASLRVSGWSGTIWKNWGQANFSTGPSFPPYITGDLESTAVNEFAGQYFTIASTATVSINPLPLKFISTNTMRQGNRIAVEWSIAEIPLASTQFMIQYSDDGINFEDIGRVISGNSKHYQFSLLNTSIGEAWYRVKAIEPGSKEVVSPILKLSGINLTGISVKTWPNPVSDNLHLRIVLTRNARVEIRIVDASQRVIQQQTSILGQGTTDLNFDTRSFTNGLYLIVCHVDGSLAASISVMKTNVH